MTNLRVVVMGRSRVPDVERILSAQALLQVEAMRDLPEDVDVVVLLGEDWSMCRDLRRARPDADVIALASSPSLDSAVRAMRAGASDYVADVHALPRALDRVRPRHAIRHALRLSQTQTDPFPEILGASAAMRRVRERIERICQSDTTVLVVGDSGTGKDLVGRTIHENSARRSGPYVAVSCAAIPPQLMESELFGHVRGAFTGAQGSRSGLLMDANGGTLFFDEVEAMPLALQAKLLRALQERKVRPLGQGREFPFDARVIAAATADLEREVAAGRFREDLYFRINVLRVKLPPLRERGGDVLVLAQHFLRRFSARAPRPVTGMTDGVARMLLAHDWPGNVRELRNAIESSVMLARYDQLTERELRRSLAPPKPSAEPLPLRSLEAFEVEQIDKALAEAGGNKTRAARILGVDRKTLYRKLQRYAQRSVVSDRGIPSA